MTIRRGRVLVAGRVGWHGSGLEHAGHLMSLFSLLNTAPMIQKILGIPAVRQKSGDVQLLHLLRRYGRRVFGCGVLAGMIVVLNAGSAIVNLVDLSATSVLTGRSLRAVTTEAILRL